MGRDRRGMDTYERARSKNLPSTSDLQNVLIIGRRQKLFHGFCAKEKLIDFGTLLSFRHAFMPGIILGCEFPSTI